MFLLYINLKNKKLFDFTMAMGHVSGFMIGWIICYTYNYSVAGSIRN
jgi:hypothetical protein